MSPSYSPTVSKIPFNQQKRLVGLASFVVLLQYISGERESLTLTATEASKYLECANVAMLRIKDFTLRNRNFLLNLATWIISECGCNDENTEALKQEVELKSIGRTLLYFSNMLPDSSFTIRKVFRCKFIRRYWHLPHIIIVNDQTYPARMFDAIQRPDLLILSQSMIAGLSEDQLKGVIAHELRHSDATDTKLIFLLALINRLFKYLWAWGGIIYLLSIYTSLWDKLWGLIWGVGLFILVRIVITLLILGISRAMEYKTDILSSLDTKDPSSLIDALNTLNGNRSYGNFTYINDDSFIKRFLLDKLGTIGETHPTIQQRSRSLCRAFKY